MTAQSLQDLERRVPIVGDRVLIDLINGVHVSRDLVRYKRRAGFFDRVLGTMTGEDWRRQALLDGNLVEGLSALSGWAAEIADTVRISQAALQITQSSLLDARNAIRDLQDDTYWLGDALEQLAAELGGRLDDHERRLRVVEIRQAGSDEFEAAWAAWTAGRTYTGMPWPIQVVLLTWEVFSGATGRLEAELGDRGRRQLLIDRLNVSLSVSPLLTVADALDEGSLTQAPDERALSLALLRGLDGMPGLLTDSLEFASLDDAVRPPSPGGLAYALARQRGERMPQTMSGEHVVTRLVNDVADHCRRRRRETRG